MVKSNIITGKVREIAEQYPLYSQDNKQGDALAWCKIIITGTNATYYILEGKPYGEYEGRENWELYGVCNMYGGLVHAERVEDFQPCALSAIPEVVADLSELWERAKDK